jgi:dTDP-4-dehydrorhamnose 3,5-epimerase
MKVHPTGIDGLLLIEPTRFGDDRGYFFESFNEKRFTEQAGAFTFVQDNQSGSVRGVLRGLHYQLEPQAQGKLVRAVSGTVLDVAVDIRRHSPTFGKHYSVELTGENNLQLWIPPGFAHGFVTLSDTAVFQYKVTRYWSKDHERCIAWDDPDLAIDWKLDARPLLSPKDMQGSPFAQADVFE